MTTPSEALAADRWWHAVSEADMATLERMQGANTLADMEALERIVQARIAFALRSAPVPSVEDIDRSRYPVADGVEFYPIERAYIWRRTSTEPHEWVLELKGSINDCGFICRHTQPIEIAPEDVPGLPTLYPAETAPHPAGGGGIVERLPGWHPTERGLMRRHPRGSWTGRDDAEKTVARKDAEIERLQAQVATARREAIEDAAKVAETRFSGADPSNYACGWAIARDIRALKENHR